MRRKLLFVTTVLGVVYAGLMVALPPGAFFSGDEGIKWLQTDSLWRHKWTSLAIDPPGAQLDPEHRFLPAFLVRAGGEARSVFPALLPVLVSFPYALLGTRGIYLIPGLSAILCLWATGRLASLALPAEAQRWAWVAAMAAVAASPLLFYGATFWEHTLTAAISSAALIPLCKKDSISAAAGLGEEGVSPAGLTAGIMLGCAAAVRMETAMMIPAVLAAGVVTWGARAFARRAVAIVTGAAVIVVPQAVYHLRVLGSWLPPHLTANLSAGTPGWTGADLILPVVWRPVILGSALILLAIFVVIRKRPQREAPVLMATAAGASVLLLAVGPLLTLWLEFGSRALSTHERGYQSLAHTAPLVALLPFLLLRPAATAGPRVRFLGSAAAIYILLTQAVTPVPGGLQWGPRLLLPAIPPLSVALVAAMAARMAIPAGGLAGAFLWITLVLSLAVQAVGLRFLTTVRRNNASMMAAVVREVPEGSAILSDLFAVPQLLATLKETRPTLYVKPGSDPALLDERLEQTGTAWFRITRVNQGGARASSAAAGPAGRGVDLGGGLVLFRQGEDADTRAFSTIPSGG